MRKMSLSLLFFCLFILVVVAVTSLVTAVAAEWKDTEISRFVPLPYPRTIKIVPPPADLPKETAAFSGRFEGVCDLREIKVIVIVEKIDDKKAKIIHGWGSGLVLKADYGRYTAKVVSPAKIEWRGIGDVDYTCDMDPSLKKLHYYYTYRGKAMRATLEKIE